MLVKFMLFVYAWHIFFLEIYMKYVDESTGIDLFAEMERDEKTYLDGEWTIV